MFILKALFTKRSGFGLGFVLMLAAAYFIGQWSKVCPAPKACEPVLKVNPVTVRSEVSKPAIKATGDNAAKVAHLESEIARLQRLADQRIKQSQPKAGCPASCVSLDLGDVDLINQARETTKD